MTDKVYPPKATVAPDVESSAVIPSSAGPCFVMIRPILAAWAVVLVCFCTLVLAVVFSMMGVFVEMIYENTFALDAHTVLSAFGFAWLVFSVIVFFLIRSCSSPRYRGRCYRPPGTYNNPCKNLPSTLLARGGLRPWRFSWRTLFAPYSSSWHALALTAPPLGSTISARHGSWL